MKFFLPLLILLLGAACGGEDEETTDPETTNDTNIEEDVTDSGTETEDSDSDSSDGPEDSGNLDDDAPTGSCEEGSFVSRIRGSILDQDSVPIEGAKAVVCVRSSDEVLTCLQPVTVDEEGAFMVNVSSSSRCMSSLAIRSFSPSGGRSANYCRLNLSNAANVVHVSEPLKLYTTTQASVLPEGPDDEERTIIFEDGLELDVVPSAYFGEVDGYDRFSAVAIDPATPLCFLEGSPDLAGLYAFSPEGNVNTSGYPFRIPNTTDLPANSSVDFYILGALGTTLPDGEEIHEASWENFGTGVVSEDGTMIENGEGFGLPALTWFGWAGVE